MKLLVLLVLISFAYVRLEFDLSLVLEASPKFLALSLLCFMAWQLSMAYRWRYCIRKLGPEQEPAGIGQLIAVMWLGNLVSISLLPSIIGQDAVKLAKWKTISNSFAHAAQSIVMLRITGASGILVIGLFCLPGLVVFDIVSIDYPGFGSATLMALAGVLLLGLAFALVVRFSRILKAKIARTIWHRWCSWSRAIVLIDVVLILAGIGSQLLFVTSASLALLSATSIGLPVAVAVTGSAALGRLLPLSFLGITVGEGVAVYLLRQLGSSYQEITVGVGLLVIFLYLTSILGLIMEMSGRSARRIDVK